MSEEQKTTANGYGKRPLWQWVLLYVVIGGLIYGLVYYFVFAKKGGYHYGSTGTVNYGSDQTGQTQSQAPSQPQTQQYQMSPATSPASAAMVPANGSLTMTKSDPAKGSYLADAQGMTLYVFDVDKPGVSSCIGGCAMVWPPFTVGSSAPAQIPANFTTIKRADGSMQYAFKSKPLYYYARDKQPGDVMGDGIGGAWHLVKP